MRSAFRSFLLLRNQSQHPFHQVPSESIWCVCECVEQSAGPSEWFGHLRSLGERMNCTIFTLSEHSFGLPSVNPVCHHTHPSEDTTDTTRLPLNLIQLFILAALLNQFVFILNDPSLLCDFFLFLSSCSPSFFFKLLLWDSPPFGVYFQIYKEQILSLRFSYFDWWGFGKGAGHCGLISVKLWKSIFCKSGVCLGVKEDFIKKTLLPLETLETTLYLKRRRHRQTNVWF